jgi:hypothetical protein
VGVRHVEGAVLVREAWTSPVRKSHCGRSRCGRQRVRGGVDADDVAGCDRVRRVEGDRAWTAGHLEQGQVVDFSSIEISLPHQGHRVDLDDLLSLEQQQVV